MKDNKTSIYRAGVWALLVMSAVLTAILAVRPVALEPFLAGREPALALIIGASMAAAAGLGTAVRAGRAAKSVSDALGMLSGGDYSARLDDIPGWLGDVPEAFNGLARSLREHSEKDRIICDEAVMLKEISIGLKERLSTASSDLSRKEALLGDVNSEILNVNQSKAELASRMCREIRLPLNTIIGIADFLKEQRAGPLNGRQLEYMEKIRDKAAGVLDIEGNILEYSTLDTSGPSSSKDTDISEAVKDAASSVARLAESMGVSVSMDVPHEVIRADPDKLRYIIQSLLQNAIKFNIQGGTARVRARTVPSAKTAGMPAEAGAPVPETDAGFIELLVEDTGIGICPERRDELFKPFTQIDDDMGRKPAGAGLSLYLVKKSLERLGGNIWVESAPAGGSVFHVLLRKATEGAAAAEVCGTRRKVLLVEDDPDQLKVVTAFLSGGCYDIIAASDGLEALKILEDETPDIILTDVMMPHLDGIELCRAVKRQDRFKLKTRVPVVMMTSRTDMDNKLSAIKAGADDVIFKPVDRRLLLERVKYLLEAKQELDGVMASYKNLEKEALVDPLTGLSNRRHLDDVIAREFANAKRYARNLSVLMMDLDHFKAYNDMFGHQAGDELLRKAASVFLDSVREVDFVARYGGEEFMVILPETTTELALVAAERIRESVEKGIPVTLSIGQASYPDNASELTELMRNADAALYHAKQCGRNRTACYSELSKAEAGEKEARLNPRIADMP